MNERTPIEEWRVVPSFTAYSVSSLGRVRRDALVRGGHGSIRIPAGCLKPKPLPLGHMQVTLSMGGKATTVLVHRLVAEAFLEPAPPGKDCVCHKDDDPSNNRPGNLFWGNRTDNSNDKVKKGRQAIGTRVASAKLDEAAVRIIRVRVAAGDRQRDVAADYGVTQSNIASICTRQTWAHVT